ncbi:hypothetical protein FRC04_008127 [Tulasnella sp. 424]|nr:hypothetical protein FRC04_008127 [Tulasnella sp. 424]KAG8974784.1 hypothetical protein FRC05_006945 [Tulasnella sp. 425]
MSPVNPGVYRIQNDSSKTYLQMDGDKAEGWKEDFGEIKQRWVVQKAKGKDGYVIFNMEGKKFLHVDSKDNGKTVECQRDQPARWDFKKIDNDTVEVHLANSNLCLDLDNGRGGNNIPVHIYWDGDKKHQRWNFKQVATLEEAGHKGECDC